MSRRKGYDIEIGIKEMKRHRQCTFQWTNANGQTVRCMHTRKNHLRHEYGLGFVKVGEEHLVIDGVWLDE